MQRILVFFFLFLLTTVPALAESLDSLIAKAEGGSAQAQIELGRIYLNGREVKADPYRAVYWYRMAANQKDPRGQAALGWMYDTGKGVFKSPEQAQKWYLKAARQGHASAQFRLGRLYEEGKGSEQDIENARYWYSKAAKQGYGKAKKSLARLPSTKHTPPLSLQASSKKSRPAY